MAQVYGPLALIGGAEWQEGCVFDDALLAYANTDEVLILPTAAAYEFPDKSVEHAEGYFRHKGINIRPIMLLSHSDASRQEFVDAISKAKFIYLGGGSPLHLRSVLKDTPCWQALVNSWRSGAVIAGSSAGGMVLSDPMVDPRGGAFTLGLGLIRNIALIPHYSDWSNDRRRRTHDLGSKEIVSVGVDERTALIRWPDGTWESSGLGNIEAIHQGESISLDELENYVEVS